MSWYVFFFFQAEDGIRDLTVTGVQTCALPISSSRDAAKKILEWLDGMDPERRHRDVITKELRWSVTGTDRIADMDYSVHEALLDLLERGNSATSKRPHAP